MSTSKMFPRAQREADRIQQKCYRILRRNIDKKTRADTLRRLEAVRSLRNNMRLLESMDESGYRTCRERSEVPVQDDFNRFAELVLRFKNKFGEECLARLEAVFTQDGFFSKEGIEKIMSGDKNALESKYKPNLRWNYSYRYVIIGYLLDFPDADKLGGFLDRMDISTWGSASQLNRGYRLYQAIEDGKVPELLEELERNASLFEKKVEAMRQAKVRKGINRFTELVLRFKNKFGEECLARLEAVFTQDGFFSKEGIEKVMSRDIGTFGSRYMRVPENLHARHRNSIMEYLLEFPDADKLSGFLDRIEIPNWGRAIMGSGCRGLRLYGAIEDGKVPELLEELEKAAEKHEIKEKERKNKKDNKEAKRRKFGELREAFSGNPLLQRMIALLPSDWNGKITPKTFFYPVAEAEFSSLARNNDTTRLIHWLCKEHLQIKPKDKLISQLEREMRISQAKLSTYRILRKYWEGQISKQDLQERLDKKGCRLLEINDEQAAIEVPIKGVERSKDSISRSRVESGIGHFMKKRVEMNSWAVFLLKSRLKS